QPCILPRAQVAAHGDAARESKVINRATSTLEPGQQAGSGVRGDLELDRSARLLLNHHRSRSDCRTRHERPDLDLHEVTTSQLAVAGEVEESPIPHSACAVKEEAD